MARKTFTAEDKAAWRERKEQALARYREARAYADEHADDVGALIEAAAHQLNRPLSPYSFTYVFLQMAALGLPGVPYLDVKTFHDWKAAGRKVRKGEKSKLESITWIEANREHDAPGDGEESNRRYPKLTALFHITQTEEMTPAEIERYQQTRR